jgi:amidohydrolase
MDRPRARWWLAPACALAPLTSHAAITDQSLEQGAREVEARLIEWRRDLHRNPELGNREFRTAKKIEAHLRQLGLEVRTGVAHTGVVGLLRGSQPGPTVALRADMDALPVTEQTDVPFKSTATGEYRGAKVGVMHACGHDAHVAILMAAAEVLAKRRSELAGSVLFIFQPAEEGPPEGEEGGAPLMLKEGLFDTYRPAAIFGLHVDAILHAGEIGYRSGTLRAASDRFTIVVTGKQTHGAQPWAGVDPIVTAAQIVTSLQAIVSRQVNLPENPAVLSIGAINGGVRHNIIPERVEMIGTVRTFSAEQRADVFARMERIAANVAAANGATATLTFGSDNNPTTYNDPALTQRVLPSLQRAAGADHVKVIPLLTSAEDYAYFAARVPGVYFMVGIVPRSQDLRTAAANHSPLFYVDESGLQTGLKAMLFVTVDYLQGAAGTTSSSP